MTQPSLYLLDTNMVTYLVGGRSAAARRAYIATETHATIAISAITQAEVLFGLEKKPEATRIRATMGGFFASIQVLSWDSNAARAYGKLRAQLNTSGKSLSSMDLLIASHAIAAEAVLVTHDQDFVQATPLLKIEDWATDLESG